MAEPFLGEIRLMSFGFPPKGWALCNGQLLPINQNQALFSLLGTQYGGNGQTTFGLPELRGRAPMHMGSGFTLGERGGEENHTLIASGVPTHVHVLNGSTANASSPLVPNNVPAAAANIYGAPTSPTTLRPDSVTSVGGSQPHSNMQPYSVISFCIALQGIFPSQT
jgi:microcystin-dependent protein